MATSSLKGMAADPSVIFRRRQHGISEVSRTTFSDAN